MKSSIVVPSARIDKRAYVPTSTAGIISFVVANTIAENKAPIITTTKSFNDHNHKVADALMFWG